MYQNQFYKISYLLVLMMVMHFSVAFTQSLTISGTLIDEESKEPLIFATIGLMGHPYGTISNASGDFDFHVDAKLEQATMVVSMLGYQSKKINVASLIRKKNTVIALKKAPLVLDEIVIQEKLKPSEIIEIAINKIPVNYPRKPFLLEGFYRDLKRVNGEYISLLEAAIQIFDHDYAKPRNPFRLKEKVGLVEIRKSLGYNHRYTQYFDQGNLLEQLLLHNNIRYHDFPIDSSSVGRETPTEFNGRRVHVIHKNYDKTKIKFFIDVETYAILKLEYESEIDEHILNPNDKYKDYLNRLVVISKTIEFKEYRGKYYLNYMTFYKRNQWYHNTRRTLDYDVELYEEMLINNIHSSTEKRIHSSKKMKKYGLQYQDLPYNATFWKNYNVIKRTPLNEVIIKDLERSGNLEGQFKDN